MPNQNQNQDKDLHVKVVYASAVDPYNDSHVPPSTTVGVLKAAVLEFFKLKEGARPDGSTAVYTLFLGKKALENLNEPLSALAGEQRKLDLKLGEEITQGDGGSPTVSDIAFEDDLQEVEKLEDAGRWRLERGARQEVFVTLASVTAPDSWYQARLAWRSYPHDAPSVKFRNPTNGSLSEPTAWPVVRGFRPANLDCCVNWSEEGLVIHPEWRTDTKFRWRPEGNVLLRVLRILQSEMDDHYSGRFKG